MTQELSPEEKKIQKRNARLRLYFIYVSILKLFLGATAWQYAAFLYDKGKDYKGKGSTMIYIFRCLLVGFFDACFCCLGAFIAELMEKSKNINF